MQLCGLPTGEEARVTMLSKQEMVLGARALKENGDHILEECYFVRVQYDGRSKAFNACVRMKD